MNNRQKAKYWKRRYQELANQPVRPRFVISERKVERLSYTTVVDHELYMQGIDNPELQKQILGDVMDKLADRAKNFIDITVEQDMFSGGWRFNGRLDIARPIHGCPNLTPEPYGTESEEKDDQVNTDSDNLPPRIVSLDNPVIRFR